MIELEKTPKKEIDDEKSEGKIFEAIQRLKTKNLEFLGQLKEKTHEARSYINNIDLQDLLLRL